MAKAAWGKKRTCQSCGGLFYDMKKNPAACPKCGTMDNLQPLLKPRRNGPAAKAAAKPVVKPVEKPAADPVADNDDEIVEAEDADDIEDLEVDDDGDEDVIVEADELGGEADDVSEVKEHMESGDDGT